MVALLHGGVGHFTVGDPRPGHGRPLRLSAGFAGGHGFHRASFPTCHGTEFAGRLLDQWASLNGVELDFSRPGKPADDSSIEAFDGRLGAECLNACWCLSMADARERIEAWSAPYNADRPHMALGGSTPRAFAQNAEPARGLA